jgi:hypothetical protein
MVLSAINANVNSILTTNCGDVMWMCKIALVNEMVNRKMCKNNSLRLGNVYQRTPM